MEQDLPALRRVIEQRDEALKTISEAWEALSEYGITDNGEASLADEIRNVLKAEWVERQESND